MLSVIIVNWNTREHLRACLTSLFAFPPKEAIEILVVDNASTDSSAEMVRATFAEVRLIENASNAGYAKANNQAFEISKGEFVLTLNPDTEVEKETLQSGVEKMNSLKDVGCLAAKLVHKDGITQRSVRGWPSLAGIIGDVTGLGRRFPGSRFDSYRLSSFDYDKEQIVDQPMGTFLLFRRQALVDVGAETRPFDESFPIFFNEVDLLYRLKKAGWPCIYSPDVRVLHHGGESTKQVRKKMIWESHRSLVRYLWKHSKSTLSRMGIAIFAVAIYVSAFVRARGYHAGFRA